MKLILENWKRFLQETEERAARPPYTLPISFDQLLARVEQWLKANTPRPKGTALSLKKKLQQGGHVCHDSFGLCFDAATLMLHMAGGKGHSGLTKKGTLKEPIGREVPGEKSAHWWLQDKAGKKYDPTVAQYTFGDPPPHDKVRGDADIGFPYFKKGWPKYTENVPPQTVFKFAEDFKQWHGKAYGEVTAFGMDWWFEEKERAKQAHSKE